MKKFFSFVAALVLCATTVLADTPISSWTVAGVSTLMGTNWNPSDSNNDMTLVEGDYQLVKQNVTLSAGSYEYKFVANHAWGVKEFPTSGNLTLNITASDTYDVVFSLNADGTNGSAVANPIQYAYDTLMYVAGNFTNWAAGMQALPYTTSFSADTTLEFKQVRVIVKKYQDKEVSRDTTWFGQKNDGAYMTRQSNIWKLDGTYNVLLLTDAAGDYTFNLVDESFSVTFPALPEYTYDTLMYVAGNFTNWAAGMQALPYTTSFSADSTLKFKQVRVIVKNCQGTEVSRDTTWFGQKNEDAYMTRQSNTWTLDGTYNVLLLTDAAGDYTFNLVGESFSVTFPNTEPTQLENTEMEFVNKKIWKEGQFIILRNGHYYDAKGILLK